MKILYNEENKITMDLTKKMKSCHCGLSKPQMNNVIKIMISMIKGESVVSADIAKNMDDYSNISSAEKKIWRLLNNKNIDFKLVFKNLIIDIIKNMKFKHNKAFISLDHSFEKNNFVTLMFTLKINKQCIPLWFYSEKVDSTYSDHENINDKKPIYSTKKINEAITEISSYFNDDNVELIFLADRWFQNTKLIEKIESLKHKYAFRYKQKSKIKVTYKDSKTEKEITKSLSEFKFAIHHTKYYENIKLSENLTKTNLTLGMTKGNEDPYAIVCNIDPRKAIKYYNYRFGGIETFFKNTKTAGFNLERTKIKNLNAYNALYTILCICVTWLVIIGVDYVKNRPNYKNRLNIRVTKKTKNNKIQKIYSDFNLGLTIFTKVFNSKINFTLKTNFILCC